MTLGLLLLLPVAVFFDLKQRRIPDWLTLPAVLIALGDRLAVDGFGDLTHGFASGLVASSGAAAVFAVWALRSTLGWGDVKLIAAVGAVLGWPLIGPALVFTSLVGAGQAVLATSDEHLPFAIAIAGGTACAVMAA